MPVIDPPEGGEEFPAGEYVVIRSSPDIELQGVSDTEDVQELLVRALPSNVVFTLRFPRDNYVPSIVDSLTAQFAGYFNALRAIPGVAGVSTFQDVNADDQIQDVMQITVRSDSGIQTFRFIEPQFGRRLDLVGADVAAKVAELNAIEAGH